MEDLLDYLKKHNFNRRIQKIYKVVGGGKTLVVYGFGRLFMTAIENYDLRALNIVGVSDKKFLIEDYGRVINGFKIIPFPLLKDIKFDYKKWEEKNLRMKSRISETDILLRKKWSFPQTKCLNLKDSSDLTTIF